MFASEPPDLALEKAIERWRRVRHRQRMLRIAGQYIDWGKLSPCGRCRLRRSLTNVARRIP